MAIKALKEKLEERIQSGEITDDSDTNTDAVKIQDANIIAFSKAETQVLPVVPEFVITLAEARQRVLILQQFVKEMMIPGQDYGIIPKCNKPSLFKPGAEKLCDIFGFSKKVEVINRIEDWKEGIFHYEIKAILINKRTGMIEAEGIGSCNNKEKKFASQHSFSIVNSLLKMAKKRAFIDAVLSATRTSGLFSQDIEDLDDFEGAVQNSKVNEPSGNIIETETRKQYDPNSNKNQKPVTKSQLNKIQAIVTEKNIPVNNMKAFINERYKVPESKRLSLKQADDFIKYLMNYSTK